MGVLKAIPAVLLAVTAYTCERVGSDLGKQERASYKLVTEPPLAALDPKALDVLMLGHSGLYDDFALIWSVQILADPKLHESTTPEELHKTMLSILKHQPKIEGLYLLACYALGLDFKRADLCEEISILGLQAFPDSWRIPMTQGFMASFILKDNLKAAAFYELAASRAKSPPYVGKLAKRLSARGFADGQDLEETIQIMKNVPGGARVIDSLRQALQSSPPPTQNEAIP